MSSVFVDTSAVLALLSSSDRAHGASRAIFERLRARGDVKLVTSSYVLVETYALIARRFGREAVRKFRTDFVPLLEVVWVGEELHERGVDAFLHGARRLSLVDAVSLLCIRDHRIDEAWAFDEDFEREGICLLR
jgi:predicted nucleic acid-binding protein